MKSLTSSYKLFISKQPINKEKLLTNDSKLVTFINPYSISFMPSNLELYKNFDFICSDGILPIFLDRLFGEKRTERISFDFSSLARDVFEYGIKNKLRFYFLGGTKDEIFYAVKSIKNIYPNLNVEGWGAGFIDESQYDILTDELNSLDIDIIIIGQGTPLQDITSVRLRKNGFKGTIFTCGGFFSQIANSGHTNYFPPIANKLHLRWLYRLYKEPHTRKRMGHYIKFLFTYIFFLINRRNKK